MSPRLQPLLVSAFVLLLLVLSAGDFLAQRRPEPLAPGVSAGEPALLSNWFGGLRDTRADTDVFRFQGAAPGAKVLVLGGVHPNEPAGYLAAVLLLENLTVTQGDLWLIPRSNASAFTSTDPQEGHPQSYLIPASDGSPRRFRLGGRLSNPLDQWPDPEIAIHHPSGQALSGNETRNLNRCFPGRADGSFTESVAFAINQLIAAEAIDLVIDLHEASIEYPVINAIVAHERAGDLAAMAVFNLEMAGLAFNLEPSPKKLHGLSHRELGDRFPGLYATLMESANPIQGRLRGRTGVRQILEGRDACYVAAQEIGMNQIPFDEAGIPIERRVMRHLAGVKELCSAWNLLHPDRTIELAGLPGIDELLQQGLSPWLRPVTP